MDGLLISFVFAIVTQTCLSQSVVELYETKLNKYEQKAEKYVEKVEEQLDEQKFLYEELVYVSTSNDEVKVLLGETAVVPCHFKICPTTGKQVTVTWKVGMNPSTATRIAKCANYDLNTRSCGSFETFSEDFDDRITMKSGKADLIIKSIRMTDNRNFWCQVQTNDNNELGTDMTSVSIRVLQSDTERPKFNRVILEKQLVESQPGDKIVLKCRCDGHHCDDIAWYKGPTNEWGNAYEQIYNKKSRYRMNPDITIASAWRNRVSFSGFDMAIHSVQENDAGRYWCEVSGAGYYGLGETGTDAKSLVLTVNEKEKYSCD
uniref:uncharacterized protein LOC120342472 n=1 Tax=Styela clava TaxID=7725 RepID=UPI00193A5FA3|nr:uncharacterized protein LOC120342472 [Styela clava]